MGANCCRGQNEDPYTLQKEVTIERLNKASEVGQMIKHSENADNKKQIEIEEKKELVELPLSKCERESSFIEDSTGASNIQIQGNTPMSTQEERKETGQTPDNRFVNLLTGKMAEAAVKNVKHQMITEMLEAEPNVVRELGAILE